MDIEDIEKRLETIRKRYYFRCGRNEFAKSQRPMPTQRVRRLPSAIEDVGELLELVTALKEKIDHGKQKQ